MCVHARMFEHTPSPGLKTCFLLVLSLDLELQILCDSHTKVNNLPSSVRYIDSAVLVHLLTSSTFDPPTSIRAFVHWCHLNTVLLWTCYVCRNKKEKWLTWTVGQTILKIEKLKFLTLSAPTGPLAFAVASGTTLASLPFALLLPVLLVLLAFWWAFFHQGLLLSHCFPWGLNTEKDFFN